MAKKEYPNYHKALLDPNLYSSAKKRIKFIETHLSYLYKTGDFIYKIRKPSPIYSNLALKEVYTNEALTLGKRWAPEIVEEVVSIHQINGGFSLSPPGQITEYALKLIQLSDHYWLSRLITQGKFTPTATGRLARFLAEHHASFPAGENWGESGRPEHLYSLADEIFYQVKKYLNVTVTSPLLDMVTRPVFKFIDDFRKLFQRRQKKGRIVECHGAFIPEHIFMKGKVIHAISPLSGNQKFRILDVANDLATITNEFLIHGERGIPELFLKRYISASKDRDIEKMLPIYQTLQAMRSGLLRSEMLSETNISDEERNETIHAAQEYFNMALNRAREIPREL